MLPDRIPFVSVVIPVYNDPERLQRCLDTLERQTYPGDRFEVIVVDNDSTEPIVDVASCFPWVRFTCEKQPGSYAARNRGIRLVRGEIIAFTDADCIVDCDWLLRGVQPLLEQRNVGLVAGKVELLFSDASSPTLTELYQRLFTFRQEMNVRQRRFGVTANLITHRQAIEHVGPFNAELKSGGDAEWGQRVAAAGYELIYADDAVVYHPARETFSELRLRRRRTAGGRYDRQRQQLSLCVRPAQEERRTRMVLREMGRILRDPKLDGPIQRVGVFGIYITLRSLRLWEVSRLRLGADSERR